MNQHRSSFSFILSKLKPCLQVVSFPVKNFIPSMLILFPCFQEELKSFSIPVRHSQKFYFFLLGKYFYLASFNSEIRISFSLKKKKLSLICRPKNNIWTKSSLFFVKFTFVNKENSHCCLDCTRNKWPQAREAKMEV